MAESQFQDGEIVYFFADVQQRNPMRVYDSANSRPNEIKCLRRARNGKELPDTFAPEHLRHYEQQANAG